MTATEAQKIRNARLRASRANMRRKVKRAMAKERTTQIAAIRGIRFIAELAGFAIVAYVGE